MEFTLQSYPCSFCSKESTKLLLNKQGFSIVKCSNCGFGYVNPRVQNEQLATIYEHNYFENRDYGYICYEQEKRLRVKNFERWLSDAQQFIPAVPHINALDVGCATGYCLDVMKGKGWNVEGLELDVEIYDGLIKDGYTVFRNTLETFTSLHKYSVITLFDVIEHIPAIDAAFQHLYQLLDTDGVIIMVTPDFNSLQRKISGKKWFQYKPIEHIQYFSRKTLAAFAERNGLQMVYHARCGQYADTQFILNRLNYYHFSFLFKVFKKIFSVLRLKDNFFYMDTSSLFVVFKKK